MLHFNTYNTCYPKEKIQSTNYAYIILPIITNVQKCLLHTGGSCLATRQKWSNLPNTVHQNNCHGN